jgi:pilus assembly protein CpaC
MLAVSAVPAAGQSSDAGVPFTARVIDTSADSRSISIPLNRSVIVETTVEVSRTSIVNSNIVDVQPVSAKELLITGKSYGQTHVVLWGPKDKQYVLDVVVDLDVESLNEALRSIDPQSTVEAKPVLGNIILNGTVSSAERASRMVEVADLFLSAGQANGSPTAVTNHLEVAGEQQVLLRCIVAEVNRTATRQLGINGFLAGDDFGHGFVVNQLGGINPINMGAAADASLTNTIPFLTGEEGIPLSPSVPLSVGFPRVQMQLFIKALADNSLLHILAEPNLVAISGETATFLAGGEFPIPVPQGLDKVTVEFREFGVRLNFTPVVKGHQLIRLRVAPEVSELDFSNAVQVHSRSAQRGGSRLREPYPRHRRRSGDRGALPLGGLPPVADGTGHPGNTGNRRADGAVPGTTAARRVDRRSKRFRAVCNGLA